MVFRRLDEYVVRCRGVRWHALFGQAHHLNFWSDALGVPPHALTIELRLSSLQRQKMPRNFLRFFVAGATCGALMLRSSASGVVFKAF